MSPDGGHLPANAGGAYVLWSVAGARAVLRFPADRGASAAFSGDGRRVALSRPEAGGERFTVTVHEVATGAVVARVRLPAFAQPVDLTSAPAYPLIALDREGGRLAASMSTTQIRTWDLASGASGGGCDVRADDYLLATEGLAFVPGGPTLLVSSGDATVRFVDPATCGVPRSLRTGHGNAALNRDGSSLMTLSWDGAVRRWPVSPDALIARACAIAGRELTAAERTRFLPDGDRRPACGHTP